MCIHVHIKKESTTTRVARFSEGMGSLCNKIILRLRLPWKIIVYPNAWDLKSSLGTAVQKPIPFTIVCGERSPINSKKKCYSFNASADMDVFPCCTPRGLRNFSSTYHASKDQILSFRFMQQARRALARLWNSSRNRFTIGLARSNILLSRWSRADQRRGFILRVCKVLIATSFSQHLDNLFPCELRHLW